MAALRNLLSSMIEFGIDVIQQLARNIPIIGNEVVDGLESAKKEIRKAIAPETMKTIGYEGAKSTAEGIQEANPEAEAAGSLLGDSAVSGLKKLLPSFDSIGSSFGSDFSSALDSTSNLASVSGLGLGESAVGGLTDALPDFSSLGTDFGTMFSDSMGDTSGLVFGAADGLGESASNGLDLDFSDLGFSSGSTYALGLFNTTSDAESSAQNITDSVMDKIADADKSFKSSGASNGTNYSAGLSDHGGLAAARAGQYVANSGVDALNSKYNNFRQAGYDSGRGFAAGLFEDSRGEVYNAASSLAQTALNSMVATLRIASPSKEFRQLGIYSGEGYAEGLEKLEGDVENASKSIAERAMNSVKDSLLKVSDILANDIDVDPTIRPVMDLSDITSGAAVINGMLGQKNFSIGSVSGRLSFRNANDLSGIMSDMQKINDRSSSEIVDTISQLRGDVAELADKLTKMQVRMDTGALVGAIAGPMDEELGRRITMKARKV